MGSNPVESPEFFRFMRQLLKLSSKCEDHIFSWYIYIYQCFKEHNRINSHVDNRRPLTVQGTNASSKHALVQLHEWTQQNARERRPLTVQGPRKTFLGMRERWYRPMRWSVCITIRQILNGTQTLFVRNSIKLHLTALRVQRDKILIYAKINFSF